MADPVGASTGSAPIPSMQAFGDIPGLDAALGLRQCLGRDSLYRSILGKFVAGHAGDVAAIAAAVAASDTTTARRLAHTLKGVSAQIGAMDLRAVAERTEHAISTGEPPEAIAALLSEVDLVLGPLVSALSARLG